MKNRLRWRVPLFCLAVVSGVLVTLGLLLAITVLANHQSQVTEQRPLIVVNLMAWPMPVKQEKKQPAPKPKQQPTPKPEQKKPMVKKMPPPPVQQPTPIAKTKIKKTPHKSEKPTPQEDTMENNKELAEHIPNQPTPSSSTQPEKEPLPTPVPIFQLTQAPRFSHREIPIYPEVMRLDGVSGIVKLEVLIDNQGRVRQVNIVKSAGKHFDEAAKYAILASRFYPAKVNNKPVAVLLRLPVKFGLL